jgi:signal transduction histidine kinase
MDSPPASAIPVRDRPDSLRLRRHAAVLVLCFFAVEGLLRGAYFHLGARAVGSARPLADTVVSELSGSLAALVGFVVVVLPMCRRWPLAGPGWRRNLAAHVGGFAAYTLLKTFLMWAQRAVFWPVVGLGSYDYGELLYRIPMEASLDVLGYVIMVAAVHVWRGWHEAQERRLREARLEGRLAEARLEALQAQLQPHFLFNTLNTISAVMYRDPASADRLMSGLSDLLRASLSHRREAEVTVAEEIGLLERYLEIVRARFADRLTVTTDVEPDASDARVPPLLLQPLVENAIRHTVGERPGPGRVSVSVARDGDRLRLSVEDDGPGIHGEPGGVIGKGLGLANTRDRLAWLHGDAAAMTLRNRPEGGLSVEVVLPLVRAHPRDQAPAALPPKSAEPSQDDETAPAGADRG